MKRGEKTIWPSFGKRRTKKKRTSRINRPLFSLLFPFREHDTPAAELLLSRHHPLLSSSHETARRVAATHGCGGEQQLSCFDVVQAIITFGHHRRSERFPSASSFSSSSFEPPLCFPALWQQQQQQQHLEEEETVVDVPEGRERAPRRRLGGKESNFCVGIVVDVFLLVASSFVFDLDLCYLLRLQRPLGDQLDRVR